MVAMVVRPAAVVMVALVLTAATARMVLLRVIPVLMALRAVVAV